MKIIKTLAQAQINTALTSLVQIKEQTQYLANRHIKQASNQIEVLLRETLLQNPKQVMSKGYAVVRSDGKAIRSVQQLQSSHFSVEIQDGLIEAQVIEVKAND